MRPELNDDFVDMLRAHGISETDFETAGNVYQIGLPPRRIDLLTAISGVTFDEAWSTRVRARLGEIPADVLGRDAMITNKRATDRPKDRVDADELEHLDG